MIEGELRPLLASVKSEESTPVTDSEKVTVHCTEEALVGEPVTRVIEEAVGAVLSTVTTVPVVKVEGESALPAVSRIVLLASSTSSRIVPSPEPLSTVTVRLEPEPLTPVIEAPETPLVVRAKSEETTGETDSEKVTVKEIELELVGLEAAIEETEGAVLSTVYTWPVKPPEIRPCTPGR